MLLKTGLKAEQYFAAHIVPGLTILFCSIVQLNNLVNNQEQYEQLSSKILFRTVFINIVTG
jgi:hypothetical protein